MKKLFVFLIILGSFGLSAQKLSEKAQFGLVTISPGSSDDAIYQIWGHTVLHLRDPENNINECYDYGTFSFDQPGFVVKFLKGTLPYQMAKYDFQLFVDHYKNNENRSASEQILNLSAAQKQDLYDFLMHNYLPENREYRYRFFYYNCSSRIRDILTQVCKDSLQFSPTLHADSSYRQWINKYAAAKQPWTNLGMQIAIGIPSDEKTKESGAMFLPDNLAIGFDSAVIVHNNVKQPFVLAKNQLTYVDEPELPNGIFSPVVVLIMFLIIITFLSFSQKVKQKYLQWFDYSFFGFLGIAGWFLMGLWFITDHGVTENNLNVIWAFPLFFPMIFFLKNKKIITPIFYIYLIINIILLISWKFIPQELPIAIIPLILTVFVRIYFNIKK